GFMGGINLADEYINKRLKHGHWKDTALELHGDAVRSLVYMFLSMWRGITGVDEVCDEYMPPVDYIAPKSSGFVQPYSDSPIDEELVGEMTYLNMINRAGKYIYICTPYLIIDNESVTALTLAAKSGVDVRIITPHIGDKWYVHMVTRAYYPQLIAGGVKIYEYEPGFIHAKTFVSDDQIATVGTINLDYRSLYLHYECGVWMYGTSAIGEMKEDFLKTQEKSIPIDMNSPIIKSKGIKKLVCAVLRVFAPLM
ncbi:MAG: phospholipase D-like domain-containing protein, partial [Oscillospiraceae bacterium]